MALAKLKKTMFTTILQTAPAVNPIPADSLLAQELNLLKSSRKRLLMNY